LSGSQLPADRGEVVVEALAGHEVALAEGDEDRHRDVDLAAGGIDRQELAMVVAAPARLGDGAPLLRPVQALRRDRRREGLPPDAVVVGGALAALVCAAHRQVLEDAVRRQRRERFLQRARVLRAEVAIEQGQPGFGAPGSEETTKGAATVENGG